MDNVLQIEFFNKSEISQNKFLQFQFLDTFHLFHFLNTLQIEGFTDLFI